MSASNIIIDDFQYQSNTTIRHHIDLIHNIWFYYLHNTHLRNHQNNTSLIQIPIDHSNHTITICNTISLIIQVGTYYNNVRE